MKTNKWKIIALIFSIGLGILISTLMKSNLESYAPVTLSSLESTEQEIMVLNNEVNELRDIVEEKEEELESFKSLSSNEGDIANRLSIELVTSKSISGHLALTGPGIKIKMFDNPEDEIIGDNVNDDIIHDIDVLNILNDLRIAGAEAMSINGERVMGTSELKCAGPTIRINGNSIGTPFIIEAIGDSQLLMAAVNAPGTYGDSLKNVYNIGFEPEVKNELFIPAYSGEGSFKYAKPIDEEEK